MRGPRCCWHLQIICSCFLWEIIIVQTPVFAVQWGKTLTAEFLFAVRENAHQHKLSFPMYIMYNTTFVTTKWGMFKSFKTNPRMFDIVWGHFEGIIRVKIEWWKTITELSDGKPSVWEVRVYLQYVEWGFSLTPLTVNSRQGYTLKTVR